MPSDRYDKLRRASNRRLDALWRSLRAAGSQEASNVTGAPSGAPVTEATKLNPSSNNNDERRN